MTTRKADYREEELSGMVSWNSPSNIALIKYWGKRGNQLPQNPSISFTLSKAHTITAIEYDTSSTGLDFLFEDQPAPRFLTRIEKVIGRLVEHLPYLKSCRLKIDSRNSFPHSAGIASSASSMSALVLCLLSIDDRLREQQRTDELFLRDASLLSRLCSGSASRSVFPFMAQWGRCGYLEESSDEYAIPYPLTNPLFRTIHDDILIVSREKKKVSSSAGHALMNDNIYATSRYDQAHKRMGKMLEVLRMGDLMEFGKIVENEALTLHALMMCSDPSYMLMKPATLTIINKIRQYRQETGNPLYFTLDAGPNVHVLYPHHVRSQVSAFIAIELKQHCCEGQIIEDHVGSGPELLYHENPQ